MACKQTINAYLRSIPQYNFEEYLIIFERPVRFYLEIEQQMHQHAFNLEQSKFLADAVTLSGAGIRCYFYAERQLPERDVAHSRIFFSFGEALRIKLLWIIKHVFVSLNRNDGDGYGSPFWNNLAAYFEIVV